VPRRTTYYKPCKAPPKVQERFEAPIKAMIVELQPNLTRDLHRILTHPI
jgi:hypothetical protein